MLAHPAIAITVSDLVVEVASVAGRPQESLPRARRKPEELVRLPCVELELQNAGVGVIARGVEGLAADIERGPGAGVDLAVDLPTANADASLLALALGGKPTSGAKQGKAAEGSLGGALLWLLTSEPVQQLRERHA